MSGRLESLLQYINFRTLEYNGKRRREETDSEVGFVSSLSATYVRWQSEVFIQAGFGRCYQNQPRFWNF